MLSIFSYTSSNHCDTQMDYLINSLSISSCNQQKDLRILISSDLSWSHHISRITSRAYKILCLLRHTFASSNNVATKKKLYISLVRSQLTYGSQVWRPLLKFNDYYTLLTTGPDLIFNQCRCCLSLVTCVSL